MGLRMVVFVLILTCTHWALWICKLMFSPHFEKFRCYSSKNVGPITFPYYFWTSNYMYAILFGRISQVPRSLVKLYLAIFLSLVLRLDNLILFIFKFTKYFAVIYILLLSKSCIISFNFIYWFIKSRIWLNFLISDSMLRFFFYLYKFIFFISLRIYIIAALKLCVLIPISRLSQSLCLLVVFSFGKKSFCLLIYWVICNYILKLVNYMFKDF